jgi:plastocyanin
MRLVLPTMVALALAGCGGDEPAAEARGGTTAIALDDFFIEPQDVRASGRRIRFEVTNRGRLPHNFRVRDDERERVQVTTMLPGDGETATAALAPGDYKMVCTVANHEQLGMTGTLVVR